MLGSLLFGQPVGESLGIINAVLQKEVINECETGLGRLGVTEQAHEQEVIVGVPELGVADGGLVLVEEAVGPRGVVGEILEVGDSGECLVGVGDEGGVFVLGDGLHILVEVAEHPELGLVVLAGAEDLDGLLEEVLVLQHPQN